MLLFIGGLSGAGKSSLGSYLQEHCGFQWVELDRVNHDVVDELGIRSEWEAFLAGDSAALSERFHGMTVITVPSLVIIDSNLYLSSDEVLIRYLFGPMEKCFCRANKRSGIDQTHWDEHNNKLLAYLNSNGCPPEWKVEVFEKDGNPRRLDDLARALVGNSRDAQALTNECDSPDS